MKIALLGDIALFGKFSIKNNKNFVYDYFYDVAKTLKNFDLVIGNLETPFYNGEKTYGFKSAHIKAEPENVDLLKYLSVSHVNLANNHLFDYGYKGYRSTITTLSKAGIDYFGVDNKISFIKRADNRIAFSGFCCYSTNGLGYYNKKKGYGVNALNCYEAEKCLTENEKKGYFNIVSVHHGQEHVNYPNYDHIELARKIASKISYIFYGHHPHVLQGIENYKDSLIAYSLGNFCFDDVYTSKSKYPLIKQSENSKKSIILSLSVDNSKLSDYSLIPLYSKDKKLQVDKNREIIEEINEYSTALKISKEEYRVQRKKRLEKYLLERRQKRDLLWYLKRLNHKSLGIIINQMKNKKNYKENVKSYLRENGDTI